MTNVSNYFRYALSAAAILAFTHAAYAGGTGVSGRAALGCGNCHGANALAGLNVAFNAPATIKTGQVVDMSVVVANGGRQVAGFNLAIKDGNQNNVGISIPGAGTKVLNGELTHTAPLAIVGGVATFPFRWGAPAAHGVYTVTLAGCAANNDGLATLDDWWRALNPIQLTVQGANITAPALDDAFCRGTALVFTWTQTGHVNFQVQISSNNGTSWDVATATVAATANTYSWNIPNTQQPGTGYKMRLVDTRDNAVVTESPRFTVSTGPVINLQPNDVSVCLHGTFTLSVGAEGAGNLFRWRKNGVDIVGATNATYMDSDATIADSGDYDVVIFGCGQSISRTAKIRVMMSPAITLQPVNTVVCDGQPTTLTISASGDSLKYQWFKNGEAMPDKVQPSLVWGAASIFDEAKYYCIISGACAPAVRTDTARLTILEPPKLTGWSPAQSLSEGDTLRLTVQTVGRNLQYVWRKNGVVVPGAFGSTLVINGVARADSGSYTCMVRNICDSIGTGVMLVTVKPGSGPGVLSLATSTLDIGTLAVCARKDTTIGSLLRNRGGSPVTITSISVDPANVVLPIDLDAPIVIPAGGTRDVLLRVTPRTEGNLSATVSFFTSQGRIDLAVSGTIVSVLRFVRDTVTFIPDVATQPERCNTLEYIQCESVVITAVRLTGSGASSYRVRHPSQLPITLVRGQGFEVCVEAIGTSGGTAVVELESNGGKDDFVVARDFSAGVDEDQELAGVTITPNPTFGNVTVTMPSLARAVRIIDITGTVVRELSVSSQQLVWDGRSDSGLFVAPGLYFVAIDTQYGRVTKAVTVVR